MRRLSIALSCIASPVLAQEAPRTVACAGQRIDAIVVDAQAPTVTRLQRVPVIGNVLREAHVVTRDRVIRNYLLLDVGDRCAELRRAESERILRAQPFIADASVDVVPNQRGGVDLHVETIDEASVILSGSVAGGAPAIRSARLGSSNLGGLGLHTSMAWRYKRNFDDRLEFRVADYQFLGQPYVLSLRTYRDALGRDDRAEIMSPFRTDLQRFAWRAMVGEGRAHALFTDRDSGQLAFGYARQQAEIGGLARFGPPGALSIFGLSLTSESTRPDTLAHRVTDLGLFADTAAGLSDRYARTNASRVNVLMGIRGLRFMRARGLDALRGTHDIPMGIQLGGLVGRGVDLFGARSDDVLVAGEVYLGFGSPRVTYRLQAQSEARRAMGSDEWDGMVTSGRVARHSRVTVRRTRVLAMEWSGAHRVRFPHALTLEAPDGGMRGYRGATTIGARRVIGRFDESVYVGSPFEFGDLGLAAFADAGRMWAGDLPYGTTTQVRGAVGVSLLLAVPMRSTRTWRLEYAVPVNRVPGASSWELRLTHRDLTSFFWREPADIAAARARSVPVSVYNWP